MLWNLALGSVVGLVLLIAVVQLNPFVSILLASLALTLVTGMPLQTVMHSFESGLGGTLGHISVVVALGTMLGKMMAESGGADRITQTLIRFFGERRVHWAMMTIGLIICLPACFHGGYYPPLQ